jgi:hypothetical protein
LWANAPRLTEQPVNTKNSALLSNPSYYSQTTHDSGLGGAANESRLRLHFGEKGLWLRPYLSLNFSQNLDSQSSLVTNSWAPGIGVQARVFAFLYPFAEGRQLFQTDPKQGDKSYFQWRYGLFAYHKLLKNLFFGETYAEVVSIPKIDHDPVALIWSKLGLEHGLASTWRQKFYLEAFSRQSPNPNHGLTNSELRIGTGAALGIPGGTISLEVYAAPISSLYSSSYGALLALQGELR